MKHSQNSRRGRSRGGSGKRPSSSRHVYESNGPDVKVRGTPQQILDKYLTLARDAQSSGDRVLAESYLQYAEHYFRILNADGAGNPPRQDRNGQGQQGQQGRQDANGQGNEAEAGSQTDAPDRKPAAADTGEAAADTADTADEAEAKPKPKRAPRAKAKPRARKAADESGVTA